MRAQTHIAGALLAIAGTLSLGTADAYAQSKTLKKHPSVTLSTAAPGTLGFTPSAADPKFAANMARGGGDKIFRFTPAGTPGSKKSVTVALRARGATPAEAAKASDANVPDAVTPTAYSLGMSVGWSRFALSGGFSRLDTGLAPFGRESVDVGLSYLGRNWRGTLQLGADRDDDVAARALGREHSYSVDLGGAYSVSRSLSLSGGVRLKRDEGDGIMFDSRRDSQSVYIGTSFNF